MNNYVFSDFEIGNYFVNSLQWLAEKQLFFQILTQVIELVDHCMRNYIFEFELNTQNLLLILEKDPENEN